MHVLWRVIVKEFLQLRQDRRMIPVIFVAPVVQITLFGFAVNTDVTNVPTVLVDQDKSAASRDLVSRFVGSGYFELVGVEERVEAASPWLVTGDAQLALVIASGYGRALASGQTPRVQVIVDGSDSSATTVVLGYAGAIIRGQAGEATVARLRSLIARAKAPPPGAGGRIELVPRVWYNPDLSSRWFYVPAVLALVLMVMTMLLSAMGVVREKEIGTMEQLMVTPIRSWQLLVGKLFPFAVIGFVQTLLITTVTVWGFEIRLEGSLALLLGLTMLFVLGNLGLGLLVSTVVGNQQQAMMGAAFVLLIPMILLSGLIFPIENMPRAIQYVTYAIPVRYYAEIIRGIFLRGSGIDVLWPQALVLLAMGVSIMIVAVLRFRKRLD
ncbi:MAG: ABC transporter permease [Acidobacteria bacterium]|jgi:ABC-2 type transport system permease protein|nr:ABC transporter permease [Acidobacteriota bacterium]